MPRERQNPRAAREALANDRLRTAVDVISTLDSMRVRQEQLDMARGEQEAQADLRAQQIAESMQAAEKAKYDLWERTRAAEDTANLSQTLRTIDPDDSDAVAALEAGRAGFIYAGRNEKEALEQKAALAEARRVQFRDNEMKFGVKAEDFMVPVEGATRPDGSPVKRLNRVAYGQALESADRVRAQYRGNLKNLKDLELFDTLIVDRAVSLPQAQQMMDRHQEVRDYLKAASELGIDSNLIAAAAKAGQVNVRSKKGANTFASDVAGDSGDTLDTSTAVLMFDDLDSVRNTSLNGGPTLGSLVNERTRTRAQVGEAKAVATDRVKALQGMGDALRLIPEGQRAAAAKSLAEATGLAATELLQASEAERNIGSADPQELQKNVQASDAAGAKVLESLKPAAPKDAAKDQAARVFTE